MNLDEFKTWLKTYNFSSLPTLGGKELLCRPVLTFNDRYLKFLMNVDVQESGETKVYGWVIESRLKNKNHDWNQSKTLYINKEIALHAVLQKEMSSVSIYEFRIIPVYIYTKEMWRKHQIFEIIESD